MSEFLNLNRRTVSLLGRSGGPTFDRFRQSETWTIAPTEAIHPAPDAMWKDARSRQGDDVDNLEADDVSELLDSLSWGEEVSPPVVKTRRRGTLTPCV